jgi:putative ABC transport system ATP-binding protein
MLATTALRFRHPARPGGAAFALATPPLEAREGERIALVGPSGCGKSTLLSLLAGRLVPESGEIRFRGERIDSLADEARRAFRIRQVGQVFQDFRLVDHLDAFGNILLPCRINPALPLDRAARERAETLADRLGLSTRLGHRPHELSHGERQRVAVARALLARPAMLLADEPTGNLDPRAKETLLDELFRLARDEGTAVLVATHDHALLPRFDRTLDLGKAAEGLAW